MSKKKYAVVGYFPDYDTDTEKELVEREVFSEWETKEQAEQAKKDLIKQFGHDCFWFLFGLLVERIK